jgi:hypothetical protein
MSYSYKIHYPESFPPRRYWTSSLTVPWWVNKRQVVFGQPELPNPPFATITREYQPMYQFQVPCDTIAINPQFEIIR